MESHHAGRGASAPIVWEDQIFLTCGIDGKNTVLCYDRDGNEVWRKAVGTERAGKHKKGSGSNPSARPLCRMESWLLRTITCTAEPSDQASSVNGQELLQLASRRVCVAYRSPSKKLSPSKVRKKLRVPSGTIQCARTVQLRSPHAGHFALFMQLIIACFHTCGLA